MFTAAWRMIQPLLDERTRNKIDILGSDVSKMYDNIPQSELEAPFGTHEKFPIPDPIVQIVRRVFDSSRARLTLARHRPLTMKNTCWTQAQRTRPWRTASRTPSRLRQPRTRA